MHYERIGRTVTSLLVAVSIGLLLPVSAASALPFNDDMVITDEVRPGSMVRARPKGSIAVGEGHYLLEDKESASKYKNPKKGDYLSTRNGERLFRVNCYPCHGDITQEPYAMGPVAKKGLAAPDIGAKAYSERTDGLFFSTIYFGGLAIMPRVGYKIGQGEAWDVINYVREAQRKRGHTTD